MTKLCEQEAFSLFFYKNTYVHGITKLLNKSFILTFKKVQVAQNEWIFIRIISALNKNNFKKFYFFFSKNKKKWSFKKFVKKTDKFYFY